MYAIKGMLECVNTVLLNRFPNHVCMALIIPDWSRRRVAWSFQISLCYDICMYIYTSFYPVCVPAEIALESTYVACKYDNISVMHVYVFVICISLALCKCYKYSV